MRLTETVPSHHGGMGGDWTWDSLFLCEWSLQRLSICFILMHLLPIGSMLSDVN
jgi:hypothetical protein